jgi:hypothetical protein
MKWPMAIGHIPGRVVGYGALCGAGILIFVLAGILPSHRLAVRLQSDAARLRGEVAEQEALMPVYQQLSRVLQKAMPQALPNPAEGRLPQSVIPDIPIIFSTLARECNVESVLAVPQVESLAGGQGLLMIDSAFSGDLDGFRRLLIKIGSLPYVRHIEEISLSKSAQKKDLKLKVWLAIDVGGSG